VKQGFIVVVEDNPDDAILIKRILKQHKLANEIVVLRDGVEAVDYLFGIGAYAGRDIMALPELVLLDLQLPRLNGLDVLKRMREVPRTKSVPVIVLTVSKEEGDRIASYNLGANSYMTKPVDFTKFAESIRQLRVSWILLNDSKGLDR